MCSLLVAWLAKASGRSSRGDAAAIVDDANQFGAALLDVDVDAAAAGVHGVFEQLLDDAGGPLDDLARGDLGDDGSGQLLDAWHGARFRVDVPSS